MNKKILCLLFLTTSLSGCATIVRGTSQSFVIESEPAGAEAELSNGIHCKTPCSLNLKRKTAFSVKISKPGYETIDAHVNSQTSGGGGAALVGNVMFGGIIGAGVDATNGSLNDLKPNPLKVKMDRQGETAKLETPATPAVAATPAPVTTPAVAENPSTATPTAAASTAATTTTPPATAATPPAAANTAATVANTAGPAQTGAAH